MKTCFKPVLLMFFVVFFVCGSMVLPGNAQGPEKIRLPAPKRTSEVSVEQAIYKRRSIRNYSNEPLSLGEVSQLLWAAGGRTIDGITGPTRAYASAGGRYPLEIYLVAGNVTALDAGVYEYDWRDNSLTLLKKGDSRAGLARASYGQKMIADAPAIIVITTTQRKALSRYGERGERYVYMDAGHLGQNVHLQAESLGLGTVMIGAYTDSEVIDILGVRDETTIYIMPVGRRK